LILGRKFILLNAGIMGERQEFNLLDIQFKYAEEDSKTKLKSGKESWA
jgi:hypothetical protein